MATKKKTYKLQFNTRSFSKQKSKPSWFDSTTDATNYTNRKKAEVSAKKLSKEEFDGETLQYRVVVGKNENLPRI